MTRRAYAHRLPMGAPDDVGALEAAFASGAIRARAVVAILGKTEGNGCVNDFSRGFATRALSDALRQAGADPAQVCLVMSGGTEGALSPHMLVLEARETTQARARGRVGGWAGAHARSRAGGSRPARPSRSRRRERHKAIRDAGLASAADAHFVQIKCPLLTAERIAAAERRGKTTATRDTLKSMGLSRAASALGVAVALGEISRASLSEAAIGRDFSLYSGRASTSAGVELTDHEIVVLGASSRWAGPLSVDHAVMGDAIDIEPVRAALARLGLAAQGQLKPAERARARRAARQGGGQFRRRLARKAPHHAQRQRHLVHPPRARASSPARSPASSATPRFMSPAGPSIRGRTAAARSPSLSKPREPEP